MFFPFSLEKQKEFRPKWHVEFIILCVCVEDISGIISQKGLVLIRQNLIKMTLDPI